MIAMPSVIDEVKKIIGNYSSFTIVTEVGGDVDGYDVVGVIGTDRFILMNFIG